MCVRGDKCNDFVFHYLLDYSCRVLFSRFCTIPRSQKTVDFIQCVGCVENSFALVPYFFRERSRREVFTQTQSSSLMFVSPSCSEFTVFVLLFTAILFSGSGRLRKCENSPSDSLLFPAFAS